jgi:erythromycin esterase
MKHFLCLILINCCLYAQGQILPVDSGELNQFKKQMGSSSIIGLGEEGHGFESINEAKAGLVGLLYSELQFEAVAFESSFTESVVSFLNNDALNTRLKNFIYPFWNTTSVKTALKTFFDNERNGGKPLIIGFDIQEDCRFDKLSHFLMEHGLVSAGVEKLNTCDSILSYYIGKNFSRKGVITSDEYLLLTNNYNAIAEEMVLRPMDTLQKKLLLRSIENRKWLCHYLTLKSAGEKMYYRDSLMAGNVLWIKNELYLTNKFILWAANLHIAKHNQNKKPVWMGEWLASIDPDAYYSIGFQKGTADKKFFWQHKQFDYSVNPNKKFDMIIYLNKLKKIQSYEWITACD